MKLGLPVPDGFAITLETYHDYFAPNIPKTQLPQTTLPVELEDSCIKHVLEIEKKVGRHFRERNTGQMPLLLSVRKSAPVPIEGVHDAMLNIGMNENACVLISAFTGNRRFALDLV